MATDESLILLREMKTALDAIRRILEIQARPSLKAEVDSLASSSGRRKMWILSDGERKTPDMAKRAGLKLRAAEYFVEDGVRAGLLALPKRGFPKRAVDLIPDDWEEVKSLEEETPQAPETEQQTDVNKTAGGAPDAQS